MAPVRDSLEKLLRKKINMHYIVCIVTDTGHMQTFADGIEATCISLPHGISVLIIHDSGQLTVLQP